MRKQTYMNISLIKFLLSSYTQFMKNRKEKRNFEEKVISKPAGSVRMVTPALYMKNDNIDNYRFRWKIIKNVNEQEERKDAKKDIVEALVLLKHSN